MYWGSVGPLLAVQLAKPRLRGGVEPLEHCDRPVPAAPGRPKLLDAVIHETILQKKFDVVMLHVVLCRLLEGF